MMRNSIFYKRCYCFQSPLKRRSINPIKGNMLVSFVEGSRLTPTHFIKGGIYPTSLHNSLLIIICLSVSDQVDNFLFQKMRVYFYNILLPQLSVKNSIPKILIESFCEFNTFASKLFSMINPDISLSDLENMCKGTMVEYLGIKFTAIGRDFISA